jgi:P pilus assembly chaperone PapD
VLAVAVLGTTAAAAVVLLLLAVVYSATAPTTTVWLKRGEATAAMGRINIALSLNLRVPQG